MFTTQQLVEMRGHILNGHQVGADMIEVINNHIDANNRITQLEVDLRNREHRVEAMRTALGDIAEFVTMKSGAARALY